MASVVSAAAPPLPAPLATPAWPPARSLGPVAPEPLAVKVYTEDESRNDEVGSRRRAAGRGASMVAAALQTVVPLLPPLDGDGPPPIGARQVPSNTHEAPRHHGS